jgi:hypothetical protein
MEGIRFYYKNVPGFINASVTAHAIERLKKDGVTTEMFEKALLEPLQVDTPQGDGTVVRERNGVRLIVLLKPKPNKGRCVLVKTAYRVEAQASAHP